MLVKELSMLAVFAVIGVAVRWSDMFVKLSMLAVLAAIAVAATVGLAIALPIWFARFPG